MAYSEKATKEDIEFETLKTFLKNDGKKFNGTLIDSDKIEPADIRYDGINYQITIGDKEETQTKRNITSKGECYVNIRDTSNVMPLLLKGAVTKKSTRSDNGTILLIEVSSTGNLGWEQLKTQASSWGKSNINICNGWKEIYLVYSDNNIKVS